MYLYMYFHNSSENGSRLYAVPCIKCFNNIYKCTLSRIDELIHKRNNVKQAVCLVAKGYSIMELIMNTQLPSQNKLFFIYNSVKGSEITRSILEEVSGVGELKARFQKSAKHTKDKSKDIDKISLIHIWRS